MPSNWFHALTGFEERSFAETQANLSVAGNELRSLASHRTYATGTLEWSPGMGSDELQPHLQADSRRRLP